MPVGKDTSVPTSPIEAMLARVRQIDGFVLACLIDAVTGMVVGSVQEQDGINLLVAAAGAADIANVLSLMTGELPASGDFEDVIVTLSNHYHLIRLLQTEQGRQLLLLLTLDRPRANLAMARREIRDVNIGPVR